MEKQREIVQSSILINLTAVETFKIFGLLLETFSVLFSVIYIGHLLWCVFRPPFTTDVKQAPVLSLAIVDVWKVHAHMLRLMIEKQLDQ